MTKEEKKDEIKNKISMALKNPILQQGFEIICKNLAELEKENAELRAIAENQQSSNMERYFKNKELEKENVKAKEIIKECIRINLLPPNERNFDDEVKLFEQAEDFIKE